MFFFLTSVNPAKATEKVAEQLAHGNSSYLDTLVKQAIDWGISAGKSILIAIVIYLIGKALISFVNKLLNRIMMRRKMDATIQSFLRSLIHILLMTLLIITIISALGINTTSFAALLASAGVAVGMALSGNLQNFAGGIVILLFRPYKIDDYIEAQGSAGTVEEIQIFHTIIRTPDNKKVYLPNGALSSGNIINYSKEENRRVDFTIGIEYGEDIDRVRATLLDLFSADKRILQTPPPMIALAELAASSVNITARVWVNSTDYWQVFFDIQEKIYNTFNKQHIGFPFPQLTVHQES